VWILTLSETIWNCREKNENQVSKACILTVFETIWNYRDISKTMTLNGAV